MTEEKSSGFIVYKKEAGILKYLLLRRSDKKEEYWEISKGHVDESEDVMDAAKRELLEETGAKNLKIVEGFKAETSYVSSSSGNKRIFIFFLTSTDDEITLSSEHSEYRFVDLDRAKQMLPHIDWYDQLKKADDFLTKL